MAHYGGGYGGGGSLKATYTPGPDDYYAPPESQVVSPAPQRANPGIPGQIQTNLANLDLNNGASGGPATDQQHSTYPQSPPETSYTPSVYSASPQDLRRQATNHSSSNQPLQDEPNFSGIPKLPFRTANVPESADERAARLERDRVPILSSSNFEDQIGWATDALNYADVAAEQERRLAPIQRPRPSTPTSERQLRMDALNIVQHMSQQEHPRALFLQGMWYEFGKFGYPEDKRQAFNCFSKAAHVGYPRAEYRMGMQFEATGNPATALQHFRVGESAGDSACCYRMGMIYALGQLGQSQDISRAVQLIRYAADTADDNAPQGAYVYGMLLAKDLPQIEIPDTLLPMDQDAARLYIERSALLGFCKAQVKMGSAYEVASLHCEFNPLMSIHYNALAARQGEPEAEMALSKWFMIGHEGICQIKHELSYKYAQRAALSGLPAAEFAMGYFHEIGWFVSKDVENAKAWYDKAAKDGSKEAADGLSRLQTANALSMQDHNSIAVSRIKSVHGSQRGNRPPRLKQRPHQQLPTLPDEGTKSATPPPRSSSAVPYPMNDRAGPTAPYPESRVPMPTTAHANGGSGPAPRPQPGQYPSGGGRPPYSTPPPGQYGRGTPPAPTNNPDAGDLSGARNHGYSPHRVGSMPNPGHGPPQPGPYPPRPPKDPIQNKPPSGAQRPPYATPPPHHVTPLPGPIQRPPTAPVGRPPYDSRPQQPPMTGTPGPQAPSMLQPHSRPDSRPGSRPSSSHGPSRPPGGRTPPPSSSSDVHPPPQSQKPPMSNTSKPTPQQRPPGTGPKTFDQMNVPMAKNDSECMVM